MPASQPAGSANNLQNESMSTVMHRYLLLAATLVCVTFVAMQHTVGHDMQRGELVRIDIDKPGGASAQQRRQRRPGGIRAAASAAEASGARGGEENVTAASCRGAPGATWASFLGAVPVRECTSLLAAVAEVTAGRRSGEAAGAVKPRLSGAAKDRRPSAPFVTGDGFRAVAEIGRAHV